MKRARSWEEEGWQEAEKEEEPNLLFEVMVTDVRLNLWQKMAEIDPEPFLYLAQCSKALYNEVQWRVRLPPSWKMCLWNTFLSKRYSTSGVFPIPSMAALNRSMLMACSLGINAWPGVHMLHASTNNNHFALSHMGLHLGMNGSTVWAHGQFFLAVREETGADYRANFYQRTEDWERLRRTLPERVMAYFKSVAEKRKDEGFATPKHSF